MFGEGGSGCATALQTLVLTIFPVRISHALPFVVVLRRTTKNKRISYPCRTPKIPGKKGKMVKKGIPRREKKRNKKKKNKERKDRIFFSVSFLVAHDCGYPLSRYTCRATRVAADFLDFTAFCRCGSGVAPHP